MSIKNGSMERGQNKYLSKKIGINKQINNSVVYNGSRKAQDQDIMNMISQHSKVTNSPLSKVFEAQDKLYQNNKILFREKKSDATPS